jgi:hypothetical protein
MTRLSAGVPPGESVSSKAWKLADAASRRQQPGAFFEKLHVHDGEVTKYVPRRWRRP